MIPNINNEETRHLGASPLKRIFDSIENMDDTSTSLIKLGCSYKDIGQVLLETLYDENEPMEDFLIDWEEYILCLIYDIDLDTKLSWCEIQNTHEFKQLLKITHSFALECQRSRYIETGIDCHLSLTISEFLAEIFHRYHHSINSGEKLKFGSPDR